MDIEAETQKTRAEALQLYNEESAILTAKLKGDKDQIALLERQKAIREKIADLMAQGFTREEATKPAESIVDAAIKLESRSADIGRNWESSSYEVNAYQRRGLSLDGGSMQQVTKQETLLSQIRDILKSIERQPAGAVF